MAASGILDHALTAGRALTGSAAKMAASSPAAASTNSASSSSSSDASTNSAMVTANDFMTLLVTEMKNQDPTAQTDPTKYIDQLVQVNSLQQLILINETLASDSAGTTSATRRSSTSGESVGTATKESASAVAGTAAGTVRKNDFEAGLATAAGAHGSASGTAASVAAGNLGIPAPNPAAERLAQALNGKQGSATSLRAVAAVR